MFEGALSSAQAANFFLNSPCWSESLLTDLNVAPELAQHVRLAVALPSSDISRASRAVNRVDREIRRAASAWMAILRQGRERRLTDLDSETWGEEEGGEAVLADAYQAELERYPDPRFGGLKVVAVQASPLAFLLKPDHELGPVLGRIPASCLYYSAASFGQHMDVSHHWHASLDAARFSGDAETLRVLLALRSGIWAGRDRGVFDSRDDVPGWPLALRAVGAVAGGSGLFLAIFVADGAFGQDVVATADLRWTPTTALSYRQLLLRD